MARSPNENAEKARKLYESGMKLVDIASKLNVPDGTVRRWKSTYGWDVGNKSERSDKKVNVRKEKQYDKKKVSADEVDEVIRNTELTDKQRLFCIYYIKCFNATKAYQKAYEVGYATAVVNGPRLLGNARVKEEILRIKQERLNREFLSEEDIFQKYMDIAFADITDYMEFGTEEVPVMAVYGPVKVKNEKTGKEEILKKTVNVARFKDSANVDGTILAEVKQGKDGASVKLSDRMKALQWLTDHMKMATEEQKAKIAVLKAKVETNEGEETQEDGFIDALNCSAGEDWSDEKEDNETGISF